MPLVVTPSTPTPVVFFTRPDAAAGMWYRTQSHFVVPSPGSVVIISANSTVPAGALAQSIGGLLNVTFGNAAELILALFVLAAGHVSVVKGQITGSIIGNSLFGLGIAILVGSWGRHRQTFDRERAGLLTSLLILVVIGLLLPALFN